MARRLTRSFFARDTALVAREVLGARLVRIVDGVRLAGDVVESEAYVREDSTNHAARGLTARNAAMFARAGTLYVYFTYGMHHCANVVTEGEGIGTAVLLRAVIPREGLEVMRARRGPKPAERDLCRGPGRLCAAMAIDRTLDAVDLCAPGAAVFLEEGETVPDDDVSRSARVGVRGREQDVLAPLRFFVTGSPFVSAGPRVATLPGLGARTRTRLRR